MYFRFSYLLLLVALLGCRPEAAQTPTLPVDFGQPFDDEDRQYQAVQQKLQQPVHCDFVEKPLSSVLKKIGEEAGVEIRIDQRALESAGYGTDLPVTLTLEQIQLRSALDLLRRILDNGRRVDFRIAGDRILLGDIRPRDEDLLPVVFYPCVDLLYSADGAGPEEDDLTYTVTSSLEAESWEELGGPGTIYVESNGLVVTQTDEMQRQVAALLAALRQAKSLSSRNYDPTPIAVDFDAAAREELRRKLREARFEFLDFRETPLEDVVRMISEHCHVQAHIDAEGLGDVGYYGSMPINGSWVTGSAETVLNDVLRPLELTFVYHDEFIEITTPEREESLPITKVYPIRDLLAEQRPAEPAPKQTGGMKFAGIPARQGPPNRAEELVDLLTYSVNPESWEELGGVGSCQPFWVSDALIVTQSLLVHEKCERLLATLRRDRQPDPPAARALAAQPTPALVVSYDLENDDAAAMQVFAKSLKEEIEPGSWDGTQCYVRVAGSRLLVKAPPELQERIGHWIAVLLRPRPAEEVFGAPAPRVVF